jgi:hypothetical protein
MDADASIRDQEQPFATPVESEVLPSEVAPKPEAGQKKPYPPSASCRPNPGEWNNPYGWRAVIAFLKPMANAWVVSAKVP